MSIRPILRKKDGGWKLSDYPEGTFYEAGYLLQKNADWRIKKPVFDETKCTHCLMCYLHCPDGVISDEMDIDYDFCKGCGICAKACPTGAIRMETEEK